jgi:cobalt ECF transporter T component CbiQ
MAGLFMVSAEKQKLKPLIPNVRFRVLVVMLLLGGAMLFSNPLILTGVCLFVLLALWWCGISLRTIFARVLLIVPFALGALLFVPFTTPGEPVFAWFGFGASAAGVALASAILLKIVIANLLLTYLLAVTPTFELLNSLRSFGVPELLIHLMQMMVRYFFLLVEEVQAMVRAQRARGLPLHRWMWSRRVYQRFGQLLGVLFVRSQVRSEKIYAAIVARGGLQGEQTVARADGSAHWATKPESGGRQMALELRNADYRYGDVRALSGVSCHVPRGVKMALMGGNGAGKSTLISLLNGLVKPDAGEVLLFGQPLDDSNRHLARQRVGVVYQDPDDQIFSPTVEEDVAFGPRNLGLSEAEVRERVDMALGSTGMREHRKRSPFELSYGQKRRVAIAGVLAMRPEVIIMDEPMAFLDPKGREELQTLLESLHLMGITLLVATHDIDFAAEWADRVLILQDGTVYAEGASDLLFDEAVLRGAGLPLPRLAQPFRLLQGVATAEVRPRNVREAAQAIWRLLARREQSGTAAESESASESGAVKFEKFVKTGEKPQRN